MQPSCKMGQAERHIKLYSLLYRLLKVGYAKQRICINIKRAPEQGWRQKGKSSCRAPGGEVKGSVLNVCRIDNGRTGNAQPLGLEMKWETVILGIILCSWHFQ